MDKRDWRTLDDARRKAAQHTERWRALGNEIWDDDNHYIGQMIDKSRAELVAAVHNLFPIIANGAVHLRKRLRDLKGLYDDLEK